MLKQFFSLTISGVSAVALACTACVAGASAALIKDSSGRTIGITSLFVDDGTVATEYNVEFIFGTYDSVFRGGFDFPSQSVAETAANAVIAALGQIAFTNLVDSPDCGLPGFPGQAGKCDGFLIPYTFKTVGSEEFVLSYNDFFFNDTVLDFFPAQVFQRPRDADPDPKLPWAKFTPVDDDVVATPEPSLIFGFITLGGFVLGSRKKEKA